MDTEAPMAKPRAGWPLFSNPLRGAAMSRSLADIRLLPSPFATGASLSTEDDFEIGGEFLEVFVRSGERIVGFLAGCMLIGGVWIICMAL
jgi:hypothetical protein